MRRLQNAIFAGILLALNAATTVCPLAAQQPLPQQTAANDAPLAHYTPTQQFSGTIRSWGHGFLKVAMRNWEAGFQRFQPGVTFDDDLASSAAALAGLYSGRADIGVLAREITPPEAAAYEKMTRQKLFAIDVLTGSLGDPDKIMAMGVFVNKDNPLAQLTFDQLDAIFSAERRRGEPKLLRTWGDLGLTGAWQSAPITPYSGPAFEAPGFYFSQTVLRGSVLWNCDLKQLDDIPVPGGHDIDGYKRVADAVGQDRFGIALTGAGYRNPNVKLIAIAATPAGPFVVPSAATVADRSYPLTRPVRFYIHNGPKIPPNPLVVEFFRYILSYEGQQDAAREGEFFALPPDVARRELARLPSPASPAP